MKIIAIDTAMASCSVAILENQRLVAEYTYADGREHSVNLMLMVERLFDQCGLTTIDMDGFAVSVGPGTFTGLRIGIGAIKGMAYVVDRPVVGVSSLDALAFPMCRSSRPVVPMIDARRGEVYYSCYYFSGGRQLNSEVSYKLASPEQALSDVPMDAILIGNGAVLYKDFFKKSGFVNFEELDNYNVIRASSVAFIAMKRFAHGDVDDISTLVPHYIRKSDAQVRDI